MLCIKCKSTCYRYRCKIQHCSSRGDMHSIVESVQFSRTKNYELSSSWSLYCSVGASLSSSALSIFQVQLSASFKFSSQHLSSSALSIFQVQLSAPFKFSSQHLSSSSLSIFSLSTGSSFSHRYLFLVKQNQSLTLQQVSNTSIESIGIRVCQLMSSLCTIQEQRHLLLFPFL